MTEAPHNIWPDDRVMVFDPILFVDDVKTPLSYTVRPATVVCRYGYKTTHDGVPVVYPDLVDVIFDHRPHRVSHGHFADRVKLIEATP